MSNFTVWIVNPPGSEHWRGLEDVACGIVVSLRALGHDVDFVPVEHDQLSTENGRLIVFNAHRLASAATLPSDAIIYNAEQVRNDWIASVTGRAYVERMRHHVVWDYSATNIERLRQLGIERAVHCRVGHVQKPLPPAPTGAKFLTAKEILAFRREQDIDVLFVGSMNPRRAMAIADLSMRGLEVKTLFGVYGAERDAWIARAKVILNVHFYPDPIFEIFRCSHLFERGKCVVTEDGGCDPELEALAQRTCAYVRYDDLADECRRLVDDVDLRMNQEIRGKQAFEAVSQVDEVDRALERSKQP